MIANELHIKRANSLHAHSSSPDRLPRLARPLSSSGSPLTENIFVVLSEPVTDVCLQQSKVGAIHYRFFRNCLIRAGCHGFELTAVETQNEGRQENLSFAADSMAHK